jgi:hypothetical protein
VADNSRSLLIEATKQLDELDEIGDDNNDKMKEILPPAKL